VTFLAVKTFLKKAWVWLKNYWHFPALLIYTLIMWLVFRKNNAVTLEVLKNSQDSYRKQIDAINKSREEEMKKRDEIIKKYNEILESIEKDYKEKEEQLDKSKKQKIKEIVEKHHEAPDEMAKEIADKFGINYVSQ
jgi:TPP-dependent pyruvate/acetoin dehydrogenase alpha subunit|tara:strand:+ start:1050 stop:1457 length:408 start_codon:yes stop_codon:yes gene_type:complete